MKYSVTFLREEKSVEGEEATAAEPEQISPNVFCSPLTEWAEGDRPEK